MFGDVLSFAAISGQSSVYDKGTMGTDFGHGEGAPVHISVAAARRRGPTLAIELSRLFEMAYIWPMQLAA